MDEDAAADCLDAMHEFQKRLKEGTNAVVRAVVERTVQILEVGALKAVCGSGGGVKGFSSR